MNYHVYTYEFSDHSCYVGLSRRIKERHAGHFMKKVAKVKAALGIACKFQVVQNGMSQKEACSLECTLIADRRKTGWRVYNVRRGGQLGGSVRFYSYASILEIAKTFNSKQAFRLKFPNLVKLSIYHGYWKKMHVDARWPDRSPRTPSAKTVSTLKTIGLQYSTRGQWLKCANASYQRARKRGLLSVCCAHMPPPARGPKPASNR